MSTCHNIACPFRDRDENRCTLIACDWVGGTAREPRPVTPEKRAELTNHSLFTFKNGELLRDGD